MSLLTIFTPTYNRAHLLQRVCDSLAVQTNKDFEWVIVDDGSNDESAALIRKFQSEQSFRIIFEQQVNAGKHVAVNRGLALASGTLFLILDSDDELTPDAVQTVSENWQQLQSAPDLDAFGGLVANKCYTDGRIIGSYLDYQILDTTIIDYRFNRRISGDKLEIFKTDLLRQFPFPQNGEKFCPEALVWNRIGSVYKFRFFNQSIYKAEYLPDGLSERIVTIRKTSPMNATTYYAELSHYDIPYVQKVKAGINYWRFCIHDRSRSWREKLTRLSVGLALFTLPFGLFMALKDRKY